MTRAVDVMFKHAKRLAATRLLLQWQHWQGAGATRFRGMNQKRFRCIQLRTPPKARSTAELRATTETRFEEHHAPPQGRVVTIFFESIAPLADVGLNRKSVPHHSDTRSSPSSCSA